MQIVYDLAPVIAEIISGHCAGTRAREDFVHAIENGGVPRPEPMMEVPVGG